jgi:hypothetical protein
MAWALTQGAKSPVYQYAKTLQGEGWYDITSTALNLFHLPINGFWDSNTNTAFHVFENYATKEIVFAFRGSTSPVTSLANWAADLTPADQGYSSYEPVRKSASCYLIQHNPAC